MIKFSPNNLFVKQEGKKKKIICQIEVRELGVCFCFEKSDLRHNVRNYIIS